MKTEYQHREILAQLGDPAESNLAAALVLACRLYRDRVALAYFEAGQMVEIDFTTFVRQVRGWAGFLRDKGVGPGDRVAFISPKSARQTRLFYACWWLGAVAVPVSETLAELETGFILRDCEPVLVVVDQPLVEGMQGLGGDTKVISFAGLPELTGRNLDSMNAESRPVRVSPDDLAALIYTSGSTGMPKGVKLSHRNFLVNAFSSWQAMDFGPGDTMYSLLPYWHAFALLAEVVLAPLAGVRVAIAADKREFKLNIARFKPTVILLVPRIATTMMNGIKRKFKNSKPLLARLLACAMVNAERVVGDGPGPRGGWLYRLAHRGFYDPLLFRRVRAAFGGRLKFMVSGGAPLDRQCQLFFRQLGLPVYQGYGLTEASPVISVEREDRQGLGSCGPLLSWLNPGEQGDYTFCDDTGRQGRDLTGELLVRGDCVMSGYWRHRDQSAKVLANGWLHTGDIGFVDQKGLLFLCGRKGNMLVLLSGEKVHPEYVEDTIKRSPLISEAMVIGDRCKNIYALVNLDPEAVSSISGDEIEQRVRQEVLRATEKLAAVQRPSDILVLPEFTIEDGTLTATLKVRRHNVWEKYGDEIRQFLRRSEGK